ncbi:hypothetical protein BLNAU_13482 [Blattamonas nauphoetae]|uniref:Superinfection immunity protein n=1 Tax=Blattamonas nauphoetae TaxID=2049346 RepID=A0ABQ9XGM0_9EUKA|nr:hypothetical protein BLNAU_13482 [Blattamonas nauphoetae]
MAFGVWDIILWLCIIFISPIAVILMNFVDDVKRSMNFLIHIIISLLCYCFTWIGGVIHAALL